MTKHAIKGQITDYDVIVIGAGAAGLAATQAVLAKGLKARCVEAQNHIGGRVVTDTGIFGVACDLGAHWLHTRALNVFVDIGRQLGFDLYPEPDNNYIHGSDADIARLKAETRRFSAALDQAARAGQDVAAGTLFDTTPPWAMTAAHMDVLIMARGLDEISTLDRSDYAKGEDWFCKQGFGAIVARHAGNVPVTLSTEVKGMTAGINRVDVATNNGLLSARAAIVTVSQGVLAAEDITFDPPLDGDRRRAIGAITMGSYNHVVLQLSPGILPVASDTWVTYRVNETPGQPPDTGGFLCDVAGSGLTSFDCGGPFSRALEQAGPAVAIDFALSRLAEIFGSDIRRGFLAGHATCWGKNRFVRGAYSGAMPGQSHLRADLRPPHAGRIFFAGEATHGPEKATVSGAHKEGLRAAAEVGALLA